MWCPYTTDMDSASQRLPSFFQGKEFRGRGRGRVPMCTELHPCIMEIARDSIP